MKSDETESALKAIVKSSFFVFIFLILSKFVTYFYRIIVARHFGPEVYGSLSLAMMISGLFILFSVMGLDEGILRYISFYRGKKEKRKIKIIFNFTYKFVISLSVISGLIMFIFSEFIAITFFHNSSLTIFFQIFSFSVPISAISRIYLSGIRAFEKIGWYSFLRNFLEGFFKLIFLIIFIFLGLGISSVQFSYVFGMVAMFFGTYLVFHYAIGFDNNKIKTKQKGMKRELFSYSWPLMFGVIIGSLSAWVDNFSIGFFKTTIEVGIYNAALPIAILLTFIPNLFIQLFAPMINRYYSLKNLDLINDLTKQVGKWIFIFNLPLFLILIVFPGVLINLFFGSEYLSASNALIFLAISHFIFAQLLLSLNLINMIKKTKLNFINATISLFLNIFLNIFLVPRYGISGAAFATMISLIIFSIITSLEVYYFIKIVPLKRSLLKISFVGFFSFIPILVIKKFIEINILNVILMGFLFILLYIILIFLTKSLDKNDLMILSKIKKRIT
jgi:O-antigen/teichoic acid export membrane protein